MPATKKRTSLRSGGKKKVEEMPAAVEARPSATGSITVANKATAASKAAVAKKAADSSPAQVKAAAQDQALSSPETVLEEDVNGAMDVAKAAEVAEPAVPQPVPAHSSPAREEADRGPVIKPFEAVNGTGPAAPAVVANDSDNDLAAGRAAMDQVLPDVNGHSVPTSPETTSPRKRIEAVTIPEFDPQVSNPPRNAMGYEYSNIDELTIRQLREDIHAYNHDRNWCEQNLLLDDITPAEARTYQLRILDISHQIRHALHQIEKIEFRTRRTYAPPARMPQYGSFNTSQRANNAGRETNGHATPGNGNSGLLTNGNGARPGTPNGQATGDNGTKRLAGAISPSASGETSRKRQKLMNEIPVDPIEFDNDADLEEVLAKGPIMAVQRLGFWKCHLCLTAKYLSAPNPKSPAAPTKWALKDISKMITHFCAMHDEQSVSDRLRELGAAFELNRGPLLYWFKTTKGARIDNQGYIDGQTSIDDVIETLKAGHMPTALQRLSNSAKKMRLEPGE